MQIDTIKSKAIFQGRAFNVRQDEIRLPNGRTALLDIVDHKGAVTILPVDENNHIWFIQQYRHAAGKSTAVEARTPPRPRLPVHGLRSDVLSHGLQYVLCARAYSVL